MKLGPQGLGRFHWMSVQFRASIAIFAKRSSSSAWTFAPVLTF
jgi:hypothetical protein